MNSTVQWKGIFARFHCSIMKMEISILYHVFVNSQLNRYNLTRCYRKYVIEQLWEIHCSIATTTNGVSSSNWTSSLKWSIKTLTCHSSYIRLFSYENNILVPYIYIPVDVKMADFDILKRYYVVPWFHECSLCLHRSSKIIQKLALTIHALS